MKIHFSKKENILSIAMEGEIDHHSAAELRTRIDDYIKGSNTKYIVMNFSKVGFMDSSGIGMVMGRYKNIKRVGGELCIISVNNAVKRILDMSGIASVVPIYKNYEEFLGVMK